MAVARLGRTASAVFAAMTVCCVFIAGLRLSGYAVGLAASIGVMSCPSLFIYAHHFKEDTALLWGCSLLGVGVILWHERLALRGAAVMGLGIGLAASGKYIGLALVPVAIFIVALAFKRLPRRRWVAAIVLVPTVAAGVFLLVNQRGLSDAFVPKSSMIAGLTREAGHIVTEHGGLRLSQPNAWFYRRLMVSELDVWVVVAFIALAGLVIIERRPVDKSILTMGVVCAGYMMMLMFCILPASRYLLPVTVFVYAITAGGWAALIGQIRPDR
jgi:4-amino-4-deoxy-L-arabinose transferase-like glycosyltransferase